MERIRDWIAEIVRAELKHREPVLPPRNADLARLIVDMHKNRLSIQSDNFLREMNIDPSEFYERGEANE